MVVSAGVSQYKEKLHTEDEEGIVLGEEETLIRLLDGADINPVFVRRVRGGGWESEPERLPYTGGLIMMTSKRVKEVASMILRHRARRAS